ncbi:dihydrodipicolinate synthase family protein [Chitinophaga sp. MM2321]|uniref:dihydrodipicolinate synthase family protein n=1 Tax=Chitinophaga sp. MM2321 TaxID=3137178 RepID=UPI0032D58FA8
MKEKFKGLWPAMFTPVHDNGEPALDEVGKLTELLISQKLDGLYILGSTGQGVLFTEAERRKVTEVVCDIAKKRVPVIVQVGALTTDESVRLARHAEKCGADGISSVGPIYFSGSADMALQHYSSIARATELPFFPYQLGNNSIPGDTISFVRKLMEIPHVTGMKLTTNNLLEISAIHNYAGDKLKLFSGSDELVCHASLCGTVGAIGTMYNLWGEACKHILTEFTNGDYEQTKQFMLSFQTVIQQILPNLWTFLRQAMLLKYKIDIGQAKAPLGNTNQPWNDKDVLALIEKIDVFNESVVKS